MHLNTAVRLLDMNTHGKLIEKLDINARTRYRIMLGIKQSRDYVKNQSLYQLAGQITISETTSECKLKFTGHCIRMPLVEHIVKISAILIFINKARFKFQKNKMNFY